MLGKLLRKWYTVPLTILTVSGYALLIPALLIPVLVDALVTLYPARQAAQIPPAEAMR